MDLGTSGIAGCYAVTSPAFSSPFPSRTGSRWGLRSFRCSFGHDSSFRRVADRRQTGPKYKLSRSATANVFHGFTFSLKKAAARMLQACCRRTQKWCYMQRMCAVVRDPLLPGLFYVQ